MDQRLIALAVGLLVSRLAHFLEIWALFGSATDFMRGVLDRLPVGGFGAAIRLLARSRRTSLA